MNQLRDGSVPGTLQLLAGADAFRSIGLDRRQALWRFPQQINLLPFLQCRHHLMQCGSGHNTSGHAGVRTCVQDYATDCPVFKSTPGSLYGNKLKQLHIRTCADLANMRDGEPVREPVGAG